MLFSIIIPVFNVEKYLIECLESIIKQKEFIEGYCEIILVDDGSTDNSGEICDYYQIKFKDYIKVFHNKTDTLYTLNQYMSRVSPIPPNREIPFEQNKNQKGENT